MIWRSNLQNNVSQQKHTLPYELLLPIPQPPRFTAIPQPFTYISSTVQLLLTLNSYKRLNRTDNAVPPNHGSVQK